MEDKMHLQPVSEDKLRELGDSCGCRWKIREGKESGGGDSKLLWLDTYRKKDSCLFIIE